MLESHLSTTPLRLRELDISRNKGLTTATLLHFMASPICLDTLSRLDIYRCSVSLNQIYEFWGSMLSNRDEKDEKTELKSWE